MYRIVKNTQDLATEIDLLFQQTRVAFDLEFDRDRHTYGFDLCLVQIAYEETCLIIDPHAIPDLQPLFRFFESPVVQKIVHCPGEDLRLLHSLGCYPANLADTEVMAKLLNYEHTSLAKLLELKCGITLDKKHQQSNWNARPLLTAQLRYAADDVLHLFKLYDLLRQEIAAKGLVEMVEAENSWLQEVRYVFERKTNFLKPGEIQRISAYDRYVLNELFLLRDTIARKKNKPAFMIMPEESLRKIASGDLNFRIPAEIPGLHPSLRHGQTAREFQSVIAGIFNTANHRQLATYLQKSDFTEEEKQAFLERRQLQNRLKNRILEPIQKEMADKMGPFAARYILSNAWISKWLTRECKWNDLQPAYKQAIINKTAQNLGLSFEEILNYDGLPPISTSKGELQQETKS